MNIKKIIQLILCASFFITISFAIPITINSSFDNQNIIIDGQIIDWNNVQLIEQKDLKIGVKNDSDYIYFYFSTDSKDLKRQLLQKVKLEFFVKNKETKKKDKLKMQISFFRDKTNENGKMKMEKPNREKKEEINLEDMLKNLIYSVEVFDKDSNSFIKVVPNISGINFKLGNLENSLIYELKIPLKKNVNSQYGLNFDKEDLLNVKVETVSTEMKKENIDSFSDRNDSNEFGGKNMRDGNMPPPPPNGSFNSNLSNRSRSSFSDRNDNKKESSIEIKNLNLEFNVKIS